MSYDHMEFVLDGRRYRWSGWFGCQLESYEWWRVPAGTRRRLAGFEFSVFMTERRGLKVRTTWSLANQPASLDKANEDIRRLREALTRLW